MCVRVKNLKEFVLFSLAWLAYLWKRSQMAMEQPLGLLSLEEELPEQGPSPGRAYKLVGNAGLGDPGLGLWKELVAVNSSVVPALLGLPECHGSHQSL